MIDTTCPMCSRCNKVSKTHTNIECPCGCWYSPPQLSPTGDNLNVSSGEYCDMCDQITDIFFEFPKKDQFPFVICQACTDRIVKASGEAAEAEQLSVIERLHVRRLAYKYLKSIESSPTGDTSPSPGNNPIILTCPHCGNSLYH